MRQERRKHISVYQLKNAPEDFQVQEDLAIPFSGVGEHLWLLVEKRNLTTDIARSIIARAFSLPIAQINYAGKKDRVAVTRQWFSLQLPGKAEQLCLQAQQVIATDQTLNPLREGERLTLVSADVHSKKCQRGCHRGNWFQINASVALQCSAQALAARVDQLQAQGFANYFGEQRFGHQIHSMADVSQALTAIHPKAKRSRLKPKEAWTCSQARAFLFNAAIDARLALCSNSIWGLLTVLPGDIMQLTGSHSCFNVSLDSTDEHEHQALQQRSQLGDIAPTGPLFGDCQGQIQPQGSVLDLELSLLAQLDVAAQQQLQKLQQSSRRPVVARPQEMTCQRVADDLQFQFWLPKGSYATECIRHFLAAWI